MAPKPAGTPLALVKTNKWLDQVRSFVAPELQSETHVIGMQEVRFWPIGVEMLFRLKPVAKPLLSALSDLFSSREKLVGVTSKEFADGGTTANETVETAMTPQMAEYAADRMRKSIEELVERLLDEKHYLLLADMILESAREMFDDRDEMTAIDKQVFIKNMELPLAVDFMFGVAKANKKVFDPFRAAIPQEWKERAARIANTGDTKPQS